MKTAEDRSASRREREFQQRDAAILEVARRLLCADGFEGVSVGRIADALDYSRGTIYLHYTCKEEIVLAVGIRAQQTRMTLMDRVLTMPGRARERFVAAGEVVRVVSPRYTRGEMLIYLDAVREKVRAEFCETMFAHEGALFTKVTGIVRDAIDAGDLALPPGLGIQDFTYVHWANIYGAMCISNSGAPLQALGVGDVSRAMKAFGRTYLDALGWRPLSTEFDYRVTMREVYEQVITPDILEQFAR